ncbi:hypothetical protein ABH920_006806 [Catenulispora sp. EB89]
MVKGRRLRRGPRLPRGTGAGPWVAGSGGAVAAGGVVRFVPLGRVVSPTGTAPNPGSKVHALRSGGPGAVGYGADLTPGNRHCRTSPADATEGNEPKTSQGFDRFGVARAQVPEAGRRSSDLLCCGPRSALPPAASITATRPPQGSKSAPHRQGPQIGGHRSAGTDRRAQIGRHSSPALGHHTGLASLPQPGTSLPTAARPSMDHRPTNRRRSANPSPVSSATAAAPAPGPRRRAPRPSTPVAGFRFVPLGRVGRACPTVPVPGSQVRAVPDRHRPTRPQRVDFTPGVRRCTRRADDATEGNEPHHPTSRHRPARPGHPRDPRQFPEGAEAPAGGAGPSPRLWPVARGLWFWLWVATFPRHRPQPTRPHRCRGREHHHRHPTTRPATTAPRTSHTHAKP